MEKQEFVEVLNLLGMNTPQAAVFLKVPQNTVSSWRAKAGAKPYGPVEVALRLEVERRGLKWPIKEK